MRGRRVPSTLALRGSIRVGLFGRHRRSGCLRSYHVVPDWDVDSPSVPHRRPPALSAGSGGIPRTQSVGIGRGQKSVPDSWQEYSDNQDAQTRASLSVKSCEVSLIRGRCESLRLPSISLPPTTSDSLEHGCSRQERVRLLHSRRSSRSPAPPNTPGPLPEAALFPYPRNQHIYRRQNVPPSTINASSSYDQPGPSTSLYGFPRPTHPLGSTLPSFSPSQYGSISAPSERPRTSHQVFHTTSDLVAHHGLPQSLPPVPRTTRYSSINVPNSRSESISESASNLAPEFPSLLSNYLAMIEKPADTRQEVTETVPNSDGNVDNGAAVQALMEVLQASPEFRAVADFTSDFNDFLTSPMESPWDDFLTTPVVGSADMGSDLFTSPAIVDGDDFDAFDSQPLFGDSLILSADVCMPKADVPAPKPAPLPTTDFDGLYTMPSPSTPALDPASLHASPRAPSMAPPPTPPGRRSKGPTGTRKNITPDALVPMDAPIQPRKYVTPSSTSRKEVPAVFARKRARSSAFGEEEDLRADDLPAQDLDAIEAKRRQNTLAARRSRKRKLEHQRQLELQLDQESTEKEMWKARATMFEALLRSHGHEVPVMNS